MAETESVALPGSSALQQLVIRGLKALKMTRYELALRCGWQPNSIYRKLTRPTLHTAIETMLAAVGATVTVNGESIRLTLLETGEVVATAVKVPRKKKRRRRR